MSTLQVRRPAFSFDENTPFQWNTANPRHGLTLNSLSFIAPAFERYIVATVRMATPHITDPDVLEEADLFLRQEAAHARAHRNHVAALVSQYLGLADAVNEINARFDRLLDTRPLRFHLAYIADIEATFTPLFDVILSHRDSLLDNGDPRVASLFLWHFVEEIEHRCAAQVIYDAVVPNPWYRTRMAPRVFTHILGCHNVTARAFAHHVPAADCAFDPTEMILGPGTIRLLSRKLLPGRPQGPFFDVPRREIASMYCRLAQSQRPGHTPADQHLPPFADEWLRAWDAGHDVINWYHGDPASPSAIPGAT